MADNNTRIIITAVDQASAALNRVGDSMAGMASKAQLLMGMLPGLGAALSVGAMVSWAKGTIDAADNMNDLSQKVGINIKDLATWRLVAEQSGTSLESVAKGVKGLSHYMIENGDKLRAAGITATDANGAMIQLADLFQAMPDGIEKTALAVQLFGKAGMDMIPMLNNGSKGLAEAQEKAKKYAEELEKLAPKADKFNDTLRELKLQSETSAIVMAEKLIGPMQTMAEALKDARDGSDGLYRGLKKLQELSQSGPLSIFGVAAGIVDITRTRSRGHGGQKNSLGLPATEGDQFEQAMSDFVADDPDFSKARARAKARENAKKLLDKSGEPGVSEIEKLIQSIREKTAVNALEIEGNAKLTEGEKIATKALVDLRDGKLKATDAEKRKLTAELESLLTTEKRLAQMKTEHDNMVERTKVMDKMVQQDAKVAEIIEKAAEAERESVDAMRFELSMMGQTEEAKKRAQSLRHIDIKLARDLLAAEKELANRVDSDGMNPDLDARQADLRRNAEAAKQETGKVLDEIGARARDWQAGMSDALTKYLEDIGNKARSTEAMFTRAFRGMEDALVQLVKTGKLDFKSLADSIITDLIRIQVQQSIMKPIAESGGLSGLMGGLGKIFGFGNEAPAPSMGFGMAGDAGTLLGFASGGDHRGGLRLVGESGPELEATGPSRIFNAAQTRDILSGARSSEPAVVVNQTLQISVGVSQTVRAELMSMMPQINASAVAAVVAARRNGGAVRNAFAG